MPSPLVRVLKGKEGCDGVRIVIDYRYVNRSGFRGIGRCNFVTVADCKAGYWQIPMLEEDKWLTAFVCDAGLFDFNRASFDLKRSGNTFVHAMHVILCSLRKFMGLFVDDAAVYSHQRKEH